MKKRRLGVAFLRFLREEGDALQRWRRATAFRLTRFEAKLVLRGVFFRDGTDGAVKR